MKQHRKFPSLKAWRLAYGLSQQEAASILQVSQPLYSRAERGVPSPRAVRAKVIAKRTGVPFEVVLGVDRPRV